MVCRGKKNLSILPTGIMAPSRVPKRRRAVRSGLITLLALLFAFSGMPGFMSAANIEGDEVYADTGEFFTPLTIESGFNIDAIRESAGTAEHLDGHNCFYADALTPNALPVSRQIGFSGTSFFELAPFYANNALRINDTSTNHLLTFASASKGKYSKLSLLTTGTDGGGSLQATVNFTNQQETVEQSFTIPDWYVSTSTAENIVYRTGRASIKSATKIDYQTEPHYGLFRYDIDIPQEYRGWEVSSVTLKATQLSNNATVNVFAISGVRLSDGSSESDCRAIGISSGFNADCVWESGGNKEPLDGHDCFFADSTKEGSFPIDEERTIPLLGGGAFKLAPYDQNNTLKITNTESNHTLSFDDAGRGRYSKLMLLATGTDQGGTLKVTVKFANHADTVVQSFAVPDWYIVGSRPANTVYRCGRVGVGSNGQYTTQGNFGLFRYDIDIPEAYREREVSSVEVKATKLNNTNSTFGVFAISGVRVPEAPAVEEFTVSFDANGGSAEKASITAEEGSSITLPAASRSGRVFVGWYEGDSKVGGAGASYTVTKNVTLKAKWAVVSEAYRPVGISSGFNADCVWETNGGKEALDNADCFFADVNKNGSFPTDEKRTISASDGVEFHLAPYNQNNTLKLTNTQDTHSLAFDNNSKGSYKKLMLLATGTNDGGSLQATVKFTGHTETVVQSITVPDWYVVGNNAANIVYRCGRVGLRGEGDYNTQTHFGLFRYDIDIPEAYREWEVSSVDIKATEFSRYSSTIGVFAVSGLKRTLTQEDETQYIYYYPNYSDLDKVKLYKNSDGSYTPPSRDGYVFQGFSAQANGGEIIPNEQLENMGTYYARWGRASAAKNIWVQGIQINEGNCENVLGDAKASVRYDHETGELTLENAQLKPANAKFGAKAIYTEEPLNIKLIGDNEIKWDKEPGNFYQLDGIGTFQSTAGVSIYGSGTLNIDIHDEGDKLLNGIFMDGGNLTIASDVAIELNGVQQLSALSGSGSGQGGKLSIKDGAQVSAVVNQLDQRTFSEGVGRFASCVLSDESQLIIKADTGLEDVSAIDVQLGSRLEIGPPLVAASHVYDTLHNSSFTEQTKMQGVKIKSTEAAEYSIWDGVASLKNERFFLVPGYEVSHVEAAEASCGVDGNVEHWKIDKGSESLYYSAPVASDENALSEQDVVIPKTNEHDWVNGDVITEPSYTEAGLRGQNCSKCTATQTVEIPKLRPSTPIKIQSGFKWDLVLEDGPWAQAGIINWDRDCLFSLENHPEGSLPAGGVIKTAKGTYFKMADYGGDNAVLLQRYEAPQSLTLSPESQDKYSSLTFLATSTVDSTRVEAVLGFNETNETAKVYFDVHEWNRAPTEASYLCDTFNLTKGTPNGMDFKLSEYRVEIPEEFQNYTLKSISLDMIYSNVAYIFPLTSIFAISGTATSDVFTLIYDGQGGIVKDDVVKLNPGEQVTLPTVERTGFRMLGWYEGDTKVGDAGDVYTPSKNSVLEAKWEETDNFFYYYPNYNDLDKVKLRRKDDGTFRKPFRWDNIFQGFSKTANGAVIPDKDLEKGKTYYAIWMERPYVTVKYELQHTGHSTSEQVGLTDDLKLSLGSEFEKGKTTSLDGQDYWIEGYYSDPEYTKEVDLTKPIPEALYGETIYIKLERADFDICVQGVRVTRANANDVLKNGGKVKYDIEKGSLILNNATIMVVDISDFLVYSEEACGIYSSASVPLNIELIGENHIISADSDVIDYAGGIYCENGASISGPGSLEIDLRASTDNTPTYGIRGGALEIHGASIDIYTTSASWLECPGIYTDELMTDDNSKVSISAQYGIYNTLVDMEPGSTLSIQSTKASIYGSSLSDSTKALGARVKNKSEDAFNLLDPIEKLEEWKFVEIPAKDVKCVKEVPASCTTAGMRKHYILTEAGEETIFIDPELTEEVTDPEDLIIPIDASQHKYGEWTKLDERQHRKVCAHDGNHVEKEDHKWDGGKLTRPATVTSSGIRTFTCSVCDATKEETIPKLDDGSGGNNGNGGRTEDAAREMGEGGSAIGKGASAAAAEKAITSATSDEGPAGSKFSALQLRSGKQTKNSVKLSWKKAPGAKTYVLYGNKCGKGKKYQKIGTYSGSSATVKKAAGAKLKKGTYYKFMLVALDKNNRVVSTSKAIHVATKGGKVGNHKSVSIKAKVNKKGKKIKNYKALSSTVLQKGKSLKLKATATPAGKKLKVKKHRKIVFESSNPKVATVSKGGVVKAKKKGSCTIYAYAQNGVSKKIKITVK